MRRFAAALGCLAICASFWAVSASAQPVGLIEEFDIDGWAYSLTPGPDGNVWFSFDRDPVLTGDAAIGRITPQGKTTFFRSGLDPRSAVGEMTVGPDGNLWFADDGKRPAIGRITPQGEIAEFRTGLDPKSKPQDLAAGPDGNVWFTDPRDSSAIGRVTPSGEIAEFSAGLSPKGFPGRIVSGPDGNLWFGDTAAAIGRVTPGGSITEFGQDLQLGVGAAGGPVVGGDGNLWTVVGGPMLGFARVAPLGAVSRFSAGLSPQVSLVGPIAAGPDGNVWFTSLTTRSLPNIGTPPAIGRIAPSGEITEFRAGMTYASSPDGIVSGPDGALWFTDRERRSIGRLVPPAAPPNTFIVRPAKPAKRNGVTSVPVAVPGPGALTLQPLGLLSFRNRLTPIAAAATVTTSAASCGNTSFRLALEGIAKARLRRYGGIRLKAKVSFTPSGGSAYEEEVTIGIGLRRR